MQAGVTAAQSTRNMILHTFISLRDAQAHECVSSIFAEPCPPSAGNESTIRGVAPARGWRCSKRQYSLNTETELHLLAATVRYIGLLALFLLAGCVERGEAMHFKNPSTGDVEPGCGPLVGLAPAVAAAQRWCAEGYEKKGWSRVDAPNRESEAPAPSN